MMRGPWAAASPAMQAWKLPTPGTKSPSHSSAASGSADSVTDRPDPLERTHGGAHVATAVVEDDDVLGHRAPLALGMPTTRGSRAIAARRARATALNCASTMWWGSRPASTRTCRQRPALEANDSKT